MRQEIQSLQAKKQQLSSSIATLKGRHDSIIGEVAAECQRKRDDAKKATLKAKQRHDELQAETQGLEKASIKLADAISTQERQLTELSRRVAEENQAIGRLENRHAMLTEELSKLQESVAKQGQLIPDIQRQISEKEAELAQVQQAVTKAQGDLTDLQDDYQIRKGKAEASLKDVLLKMQDKLFQLKQLGDEEELVRSDLAAERLALQRERETLAKDRGKLSEAERKVAKQQAYMKL